MRKVQMGRLSRGQWLLIAILLPNLAIAQECPSGAEINKIRNAVKEFQDNDRAPAGADCAYKRASTIDLTSSELNKDVLNFFNAAAQVQRKASDKRRGEKKTKTDDVDKYLDQEIGIHTIFLKASGSDPKGDVLKAAKQHVSDMADAWALRGQYEKVAEHLGNQPSLMIDTKALEVWLQAVWSCAKWDGKKGNVCSEANQEPCKDKIHVFFSVAERPSFSFLDRVQMYVKPMAQPILGRSRQLQDEMRKTERLKDFKEAPSIHDNMRALGTQLLKGERLARLVGKSNTGLDVGKQMRKTIA